MKTAINPAHIYETTASSMQNYHQGVTFRLMSDSIDSNAGQVIPTGTIVMKSGRGAWWVILYVPDGHRWNGTGDRIMRGDSIRLAKCRVQELSITAQEFDAVAYGYADSIRRAQLQHDQEQETLRRLQNEQLALKHRLQLIDGELSSIIHKQTVDHRL